jgi:hypothetical protein
MSELAAISTSEAVCVRWEYQFGRSLTISAVERRPSSGTRMVVWCWKASEGFEKMLGKVSVTGRVNREAGTVILALNLLPLHKKVLHSASSR